MRWTDAVESFGQLKDRRRTSVAHVGADRLDRLEHRIDVDLGARHRGPAPGGGEAAAAPEVDSTDHLAILRTVGNAVPAVG